MPSKKSLDNWKKRRQKIVKLREAGLSFVEIARKFCISRERVRQLYNMETEK